MSVELDVDNFDVCVTLVNGEMSFGFNEPDEVSRFLTFIRENPDHVYHGDGMDFPCSLLQKRYLDTDAVREPLTTDDALDALRRYGRI